MLKNTIALSLRDPCLSGGRSNLHPAEKFFSILERHIKPHDAVIIGVSGGPDSTALLSAAVEFSHRASVKIIVAHVNHGLRGKEALRDENFVKNLARHYGLKYEVKRIKLSGKSHFEEAGRSARRDFFEKLRGKYKAKIILTAHTEDDQLETIIFNFLRGSGLKGLGGMGERNGFYLKPFLGIPKSEILQYLRARKLKFCKDRTNSDTRFSRNFIRGKILPLLERLNPSFRKTLVRNAGIFRALGDYTRAEAGAFLARQKKSVKAPAVFAAKDFLKLPEAIQQAVLQAVFRKSTGRPYNPSSVRVEELLRLIRRNVGKKRVFIGKSMCFTLDKGLFARNNSKLSS